jgi:hypothetical protein
MKKQGKQNDKVAVKKQEELQTINEISTRENEQPLPQPKDFDEIEY